MPKVIIAIDSFKGCLSSSEACHAAASGVKDAYPQCEIVEIPVSDGGEGLTDVLVGHFKGRYVSLTVPGPLGNPTPVRYGISDDGKRAIMEMASACGLPLVAASQRNPELTSTRGFGLMIADALARGCRHFIIGIGGSSTTDAGFGMLQALGVQFFDADGKLISEPICGRLLSSIMRIDISTLHPLLYGTQILVACDVQNPLFGPQGAAHVFAPQKGADEEMVKRLDDGLRHVDRLSGYSSAAGDGAAGGLGFALRHYLNAEMRPGIELVLDTLRFDDHLRDASLVITGEGCSDSQTLMGKVPYGVMMRARRMGLPVHLLSGKVTDVPTLLSAGFTACHDVNENDPSPLEVLMRPDVASSHIRAKASEITSHTELDSKSTLDLKFLLPVLSVFFLLALAYGLFYLFLRFIFT